MCSFPSVSPRLRPHFSHSDRGWPVCTESRPAGAFASVAVSLGQPVVLRAWGRGRMPGLASTGRAESPRGRVSRWPIANGRQEQTVGFNRRDVVLGSVLWYCKTLPHHRIKLPSGFNEFISTARFIPIYLIFFLSFCFSSVTGMLVSLCCFPGS